MSSWSCFTNENLIENWHTYPIIENKECDNMKIPFIKMTEENIVQQQKNIYKLSCENNENMSFWLPKIQRSVTKEQSELQIPKTKIIHLDFEWWKWLRSDNYTDEKIKEFNEFLETSLGSFLEGKTLFMKTGVFSDKFVFHRTVINDRSEIAYKFTNMYYDSMILGADKTNEVVFREMIKDKENRKQIYEGMPLHTEFRVFYDFDKNKIIGISNYWHPKVMETHLPEKDLINYKSERDRIIDDYEEYKEKVMYQVRLFMNGCSELTGKWSIDIMKNGNDLWLIDMARMELSALVEYMEKIE